jgi:uncharacterized repeat protein (TIGR02543 family)
MRRHFFSILLLLLSGSLSAQIPNGYYNNANGKTGDELKTALHDIIKGHHVVSYGGLLNAFAYTDCKPNGKIWDIYSDYEYSLNTGLCGEFEQEGECWNREHTWPQSWFNESTAPRSDLFHVYPTDGFVNQQRSNYPYGEVNNPTYTSGNGSKLGPCATAGYSGKVFEPVDEYKGDIARSYFYMSVRYAGEDDDWGTSGMTNKAEIKPWAMTMLLRWSDEDPVSQKEIDRNNAVYGYQNNRNPFIDHPEYARMIWDPNWMQGASYNITCVTGLQHGSISAPESALEGSTVAITATPEPGYMVGTYTVYKTDNPSTMVTVSSNGTFTMPAYAVTISATFVVNNTYYNIALGTVSHGSISTSASSAKSGTTITLATTPDNGYSLYSWYVFKTGDMSQSINVSGNSFVMPAFDVTVMATFVEGGAYVKVTAAPTDWSGEYILVYEQNSNTAYVWTGEDETNCYVSKTITNNAIANDGYVTLTVAAMTGGYSVKVNGGSHVGKYLYGTSGNNKLNFGDNPTVNTLSFESNSVIMTSNTSVMRFNNTSGQNRFRYFKSSSYASQQPVQFYTKITPTHSIHFNLNGGTGMMDDQTVNEFEPTALNTNAFTKEGYVFDGWNTEADGSGDYYADEATVLLLDDLTLYAQWIWQNNMVEGYQLITSADQLVPGRTYLIVNVDHGKALGITQNSNNRSAAAVTIEDDLISDIDSTVCELTLGGSEGAWTFFDAGWGNNGGYLYAASNSSNYLKTQANNNANGQWSINFDEDGVATLQAQGSNSHNLLRYNNSNNIFSCYASGQLDVCLFRRTEIYDYPAQQIVSLAQGWNWFSANVNISLEQLQTALTETLPGTTVIIKSSTQSTSYNPNSNQWRGTLTTLDVTQMYMIKTASNCTITLVGMPINPAEFPVTIHHGNNWIAFPLGESMTVGSVFSGFAVNGDVIKSQNGNANYNGTNWRGTLTTLEPSKGYIYKSSASQTKMFSFPQGK